MNKKFFASLMVGMFLLTGVAFACQGDGCFGFPYGTPAQPGVGNFAYSTDFSGYSTEKFGHIEGTPEGWSNFGRDYASGGGQAYGNSEYEAYAGGKGGLVGNAAAGFENGEASATFKGYAHDFGNTSVAGAMSAVGSESNAGAVAGGAGLFNYPAGVAWTRTYGYVGGNFAQSTGAGEASNFESMYNPGVPSNFVSAGQYSGGWYNGYVNDQDCDTDSGRFGAAWGAASGHHMTGEGLAAGTSVAHMELTPNRNSTFGATSNFAMTEVTGSDFADTHIYGGGSVGTRVGIGQPTNGSKAMGVSVFSYEANAGDKAFGGGGATHSAYAEKNFGANTNTVKTGSSGSAFSFSGGTPGMAN